MFKIIREMLIFKLFLPFIFLFFRVSEEEHLPIQYCAYSFFVVEGIFPCPPLATPLGPPNYATL